MISKKNHFNLLTKNTTNIVIYVSPSMKDACKKIKN